MNNTNSNKINEKFDFQSYKIAVVKDDVKKFETKIKPRWYENIPLIGAIIYLLRTAIELAGIDRGLLRKQIFIYNLIFMLAMLFYLYFIISLLTPYLHYWMYKIALKKTKKQLYTDKN